VGGCVGWGGWIGDIWRVILWGFFVHFCRHRALFEIAPGWGSKGEGLLPFTFGCVAEYIRKFEYEFQQNFWPS
jgi:hypothetical protein